MRPIIAPLHGLGQRMALTGGGGRVAGMFLVTGGAGFIGSNVVASLNEAGHTDIVVNDLVGHDDAKWRNLAKRQVADLVPPA